VAGSIQFRAHFWLLM